MFVSTLLHSRLQRLVQKKKKKVLKCLLLTILAHGEPPTSSKACPAVGWTFCYVVGFLLCSRKTSASGAWCVWGLCQIASAEHLFSLYPESILLAKRRKAAEQRAVLAYFDNWGYDKSFGLVPGEDTALHLGTSSFFTCSYSLGPSGICYENGTDRHALSPRDLRPRHY